MLLGFLRSLGDYESKLCSFGEDRGLLRCYAMIWALLLSWETVRNLVKCIG